jgi:hypothetical protein
VTEQHNTLLVDGRGQGNEGRGHDPWDHFDYDRLNGVRIQDVHANGKSIAVTGEASGAYAPDLALEKFLRRFSFDGKKVTIDDEVRSAKPHVFTILLHADSDITARGRGEFVLHGLTGSMTARILEPAIGTTTVIEANAVRAPGPPGSVDQGNVQFRGKKLAIGTEARTKEVKFQVELTPQ